ncbi:unnamed protein product [Amoebophrya sp. A120]|nr:unnamed protein product [Amoebophrya sp. A120]|eukprot:GSA120T00021561001.1
MVEETTATPDEEVRASIVSNLMSHETVPASSYLPPGAVKNSSSTLFTGRDGLVGLDHALPFTRSVSAETSNPGGEPGAITKKGNLQQVHRVFSALLLALEAPSSTEIPSILTVQLAARVRLALLEHTDAVRFEAEGPRSASNMKAKWARETEINQQSLANFRDANNCTASGAGATCWAESARCDACDGSADSLARGVRPSEKDAWLRSHTTRRMYGGNSVVASAAEEFQEWSSAADRIEADLCGRSSESLSPAGARCSRAAGAPAAAPAATTQSSALRLDHRRRGSTDEESVMHESAPRPLGSTKDKEGRKDGGAAEMPSGRVASKNAWVSEKAASQSPDSYQDRQTFFLEARAKYEKLIARYKELLHGIESSPQAARPLFNYDPEDDRPGRSLIHQVGNFVKGAAAAADGQGAFFLGRTESRSSACRGFARGSPPAGAGASAAGGFSLSCSGASGNRSGVSSTNWSRQITPDDRLPLARNADGLPSWFGFSAGKLRLALEHAEFELERLIISRVADTMEYSQMLFEKAADLLAQLPRVPQLEKMPSQEMHLIIEEEPVPLCGGTSALTSRGSRELQIRDPEDGAVLHRMPFSTSESSAKTHARFALSFNVDQMRESYEEQQGRGGHEDTGSSPSFLPPTRNSTVHEVGAVVVSGVSTGNLAGGVPNDAEAAGARPATGSTLSILGGARNLDSQGAGSTKYPSSSRNMAAAGVMAFIEGEDEQLEGNHTLRTATAAAPTRRAVGSDNRRNSNATSDNSAYYTDIDIDLDDNDRTAGQHSVSVADHAELDRRSGALPSHQTAALRHHREEMRELTVYEAANALAQSLYAETYRTLSDIRFDEVEQIAVARAKRAKQNRNRAAKLRTPTSSCRTPQSCAGRTPGARSGRSSGAQTPRGSFSSRSEMYQSQAFAQSRGAVDGGSVVQQHLGGGAPSTSTLLVSPPWDGESSSRSPILVAAEHDEASAGSSGNVMKADSVELQEEQVTTKPCYNNLAEEVLADEEESVELSLVGLNSPGGTSTSGFSSAKQSPALESTDEQLPHLPQPARRAALLGDRRGTGLSSSSAINMPELVLPAPLLSSSPPPTIDRRIRSAAAEKESQEERGINIISTKPKAGSLRGPSSSTSKDHFFGGVLLNFDEIKMQMTFRVVVQFEACVGAGKAAFAASMYAESVEWWTRAETIVSQTYRMSMRGATRGPVLYPPYSLQAVSEKLHDATSLRRVLVEQDRLNRLEAERAERHKQEGSSPALLQAETSPSESEDVDAGNCTPEGSGKGLLLEGRPPREQDHMNTDDGSYSYQRQLSTTRQTGSLLPVSDANTNSAATSSSPGARGGGGPQRLSHEVDDQVQDDSTVHFPQQLLHNVRQAEQFYLDVDDDDLSSMASSPGCVTPSDFGAWSRQISPGLQPELQLSAGHLFLGASPSAGRGTARVGGSGRSFPEETGTHFLPSPPSVEVSSSASPADIDARSTTSPQEAPVSSAEVQHRAPPRTALSWFGALLGRGRQEPLPASSPSLEGRAAADRVENSTQQSVDVQPATNPATGTSASNNAGVCRSGLLFGRGTLGRGPRGATTSTAEGTTSAATATNLRRTTKKERFLRREAERRSQSKYLVRQLLEQIGKRVVEAKDMQYLRAGLNLFEHAMAAKPFSNFQEDEDYPKLLPLIRERLRANGGNVDECMVWLGEVDSLIEDTKAPFDVVLSVLERFGGNFEQAEQWLNNAPEF